MLDCWPGTENTHLFSPKQQKKNRKQCLGKKKWDKSGENKNKQRQFWSKAVTCIFPQPFIFTNITLYWLQIKFQIHVTSESLEVLTFPECMTSVQPCCMCCFPWQVWSQIEWLRGWETVYVEICHSLHLLLHCFADYSGCVSSLR